MVLDGINGSSGNPIDITELDSEFRVSDDVRGFDDQTKIVLFEFFLGQAGELVDSLFVGSEFVGVVEVDLSQVFKENSFSVCLLEHGFICNSEIFFPKLEFTLGGSSLMVEDHSYNGEDGHDGSDLLSRHIFGCY